MDVEEANFISKLPESVVVNSCGRINAFQKPFLPFVSTIKEHYRQLQALELKVQEILQTQQECLEITSGENKRFKEVHASFDFNVMFMQISMYTKKVVSIHNDMVIIQNKMERLKHRAKFLKEYQDIKVRENQEAKALHEERERLLTAKPVWEINKADTSDKT